jgi:hypothetical protein
VVCSEGSVFHLFVVVVVGCSEGSVFHVCAVGTVVCSEGSVLTSVVVGTEMAAAWNRYRTHTEELTQALIKHSTD